MLALIRTFARFYSDFRFTRVNSIESVKLKCGTLLGKKVKYANGVELCAFKGVPYAHPPIGPLRFQPPKPIEDFRVSLKCYEDGNPCLQENRGLRSYSGSEDCLYLNIYTPSVRGQYPVMIWFHGGGFSFGSGSESVYSPEYLIEKGVIVVTVNSRIGPFGFLSFPEAGIMGNAGLKDQQLALKWISENISQFGGDPNNVTIFGQSSGAVSCHLHLLNQKSRQYFHKIICQSGCAIMEWGHRQNASKAAYQLANIIEGSQLSDMGDVSKVLRNADGEDLLRHASKTATKRNRRYMVQILFSPTVEPDHETAFMTRSPEELTKSLKNDTHPMMIGYNSHEGFEHMGRYMKNKWDTYAFDEGRFVPDSLDLPEPGSKFSQVNEEMKRFYLGNEAFSKSNFIPMATALHDNVFYMRIRETVEHHVSVGARAPLYFYQFAFNGSLNVLQKLYGSESYPGPVHGDELYYLFNATDGTLPQQIDAESCRIRELMCDMWTSFAKYGNPTPPILHRPIKWEPVRNMDLTALEIKAPLLEMKPSKKRNKRAKFWKEIYKKYGQNSKL